MEQPRPVLLRWFALGGLAGLVGLGIWLVATRPTAPRADRLAPPPRAREAVIAEVRNGTDRPGLARQVTRLLRDRGVDVVFFGSGPKTDSTRVLVRRGPVGRGHEVARLLGGGRVELAPDSLLRVDVTVLVGPDYRLPKGEPPL